jgi:hypothetical protein
MDDIVWIVGAVAGLCVLVRRFGRLIVGEAAPGWPLRTESREEFWQRMLPWPRGVQEDADIAWHVPTGNPPGAESRPRVVIRERSVPPTRPQSRIVGR